MKICLRTDHFSARQRSQTHHQCIKSNIDSKKKTKEVWDALDREQNQETPKEEHEAGCPVPTDCLDQKKERVQAALKNKCSRS